MKYGYRKAERAFKRRYALRALRAAGMNVARAAQISELNRTHFYNLLKKCRIKIERVSAREVYRVKPYREEFEGFARRLLTRALLRGNYSASAAARFLGVNRTNLYRMARRLGVGLLRRQEKDEGNAAWRELAGFSPAPQDTQADAHAGPLIRA